MSKTVYFRLNDRTYRIKKCPHEEDVDICRLRSFMWLNEDFYIQEWLSVEGSLELFRILSMDSLELNDPKKTEIINPPFIHKIIYQTVEGRYYPTIEDAMEDTNAYPTPLVIRTLTDLPDEGPISETSFTPILFRVDGYYFRTPVAARNARGPLCKVELIPVLLRAHLPFEDPIPTTVGGVPVFYTMGPCRSNQP